MIFRVLAAVGLTVMLLSPVHALVIFQSTQTAEQLSMNPNVTLPGGVLGVKGDLTPTLKLTPTAGSQVLLRWDLLDAADRGNLRISVEIDHARAVADYDPYHLIADGANYEGFLRVDNQNGSAQTSRGTVVAGAYSEEESVPFAADLEHIQFAIGYFLEVSDGGLGPSQMLQYNEGVRSFGPLGYNGNHLNTDSALSFMIAGPPTSFTGEQYWIDAIGITVEEISALSTVPEPSAIAIWGVGLALGAMSVQLSRRRKRAAPFG